MLENRIRIDPLEKFEGETEKSKKASAKKVFPEEHVEEMLKYLLGRSIGIPKFIEEMKNK
jgi:hypothetical protein